MFALVKSFFWLLFVSVGLFAITAYRICSPMRKCALQILLLINWSILADKMFLVLFPHQINHATWNKWSSWSWLIALASATILDLIKLTRLQAKVEAEMLQQKSAGSHPEVLSQFKIEKHNMQLTFWRDFCDLFIPLSSLHYANSGLGAFCGLLSSLIGFQQEWEKHVHPFKPK